MEALYTPEHEMQMVPFSTNQYNQLLQLFLLTAANLLKVSVEYVALIPPKMKRSVNVLINILILFYTKRATYWSIPVSIIDSVHHSAKGMP